MFNNVDFMYNIGRTVWRISPFLSERLSLTIQHWKDFRLHRLKGRCDCI